MVTTHSFYVALNEFQTKIRTIWQTLQSEGEFCDMTLACEDKLIQTHKVVISAMSPVLANILKQCSGHHPYIYLKGVKFNVLTNLLNFIHQGEVYIHEEDINNFLEVGKDLEITGISRVQNNVPSTSEPSEQVNNHVGIESTEEKVNKFETENAAESKGENVKMEATEFLGESIENKLNSIIDVIMEDKEPVKEVKYARELNSSSSLSFHKPTIHEAHYYPCDRCNYKATQNPHLIRHIKTVHEGLNYPCDHCDYKATQNATLIRHTQSIHNGVRYPCDLCDKDFSDISALKKHKKIIHDGIRKHCEMCGKKCRDTAALKKHIALVHNDYMPISRKY